MLPAGVSCFTSCINSGQNLWRWELVLLDSRLPSAQVASFLKIHLLFLYPTLVSQYWFLEQQAAEPECSNEADCISFGYILSSEIAVSNNSSIFNFLRK